ncbi:DUF3703 domain-containing protein [Pseudomonas sp. MPDS]|uniref:DUF3703 domain-containing protein n=1 Tax=Pseudomonas sp. MPDS TaxID=2762896 RepID=UPI0028D862E0|nr:DUF3703 domain-containing protein [Pseudomonas sp. MPDS]
MPPLHAYSHWLIFLAGWEDRYYREMLGQAARFPAALLFFGYGCHRACWSCPAQCLSGDATFSRAGNSS